MNQQITGRRIQDIRLSLGLTMEEFGRLFKPPASKGGVNNWEKSANRPNRKRLNQIAILGEVSVNYLLANDLEVCNKCKYASLEDNYNFCPICGLKRNNHSGGKE